MTSRDTYDIKCWEQEEEDAMQAYEDYSARSAEEFLLLEEERKIKVEEERLKSHNIQPSLVANLLAQSEPSLFPDDQGKAIGATVVSGWTPVAMALMHETIKWHARQQVEFFEQLQKEMEDERS